MKKYLMLLEQVFVISAAILLLLTAVAKLFSITGSVRFLNTRDPVFSFLNMRQVLGLVALLEICIAASVLHRRTSMQAKLLLIAWIGSLFGIYRLGLWQAGYEGPCKCLGGILQWSSLPNAAIQGTSFAIFLYLFVGSCFLLLAKYYQSYIVRSKAFELCSPC